MVLRNPIVHSRHHRLLAHLFLALTLALALVLSGCVKPNKVVKLPQKTPIAVAYIMDDDHNGLVGEVPQALKDEVGKILSERNLEGFEIPFKTYSDVFVPVRDSKKRLARLANSDADYTLLVETKAIYFAQLSGRYRWNVSLKTSLAAKDEAVESTSESADLTAFVDFEHQKERQVIESIASDLARRVGAQLDEFLGAAQVAEKKN